MNAAQILSDLKSGRGTINCSGEFLSDFLESYPHASYVRDACTRKHLLANHYEVICSGLESINDLIGATPHEIWIDDVHQRKPKLGLDSTVICSEHNNVRRTEEFEKRLLYTGRSVSFNCLYILFNGLVDLSSVIKIPISDANNKKIIAFLTFYQDLTPQQPLDKLFGFYQEFFLSKREAIQHWLRHVELDNCFDPLSPLTGKEVQILLAMCKDSQCKALAQQFDISVATMSNHITHIREKVVSPYTFRQVLSKLRTAGKKVISGADFH